MIEIGIPFSDPQADGPIIQKASEIALSNGISLSIIFDQVRSIRKKTDIPIALMGYYNPILAYGIDNFLNDCKTSQIDGIILPDLPLDEGTFFVKKQNLLISLRFYWLLQILVMKELNLYQNYLKI